MIESPDPAPPARCQVCGQLLADRPIWLAASPDGHTAWAMHLNLTDCVRALAAPRLRIQEVAHGRQRP